MTKEEYIHYTECRQASFSFKKSAKFISWCNLHAFAPAKPGSDSIEVLGFLAYEIVQKLTEKSLGIKREWDRSGVGEKEIDERERFMESQKGLFVRPENERSSLKPQHILEAYRKLIDGKSQNTIGSTVTLLI